MKRAFAVLICLPALVACGAAHTPPAAVAPTPPLVASLEPISVPKPVEPPMLNPAAAAGALLEQGMQYFRSGHYRTAAVAFHSAIETDRLNRAGRALAYWHIHVSERELGNDGHSADALSSFVVVAEDVMSVRQQTRYAVNEAGDFVDRFDLGDKLQRARAALSAAWARRAEDFGRTLEHPVVVQAVEERDYFLEMMAPCTDAHRESRSSRWLDPGSGVPILQMTLRCGDSRAPEDFFFEVR